MHPMLEKLEAEGLDITYKHLDKEPEAFAAAGIRSTPSVIIQDDDGSAKGYGYLTEAELRKYAEFPSE